jgi:acetylornithine deacetylase/succinyl-diaminopimelate desuccinylase-like protein
MTATSMTVLDLLDALVRIDSVNPGLDPAGAGEAQIAASIARWGRSAGLRVETGRSGRPAPAPSTGHIGLIAATMTEDA